MTDTNRQCPFLRAQRMCTFNSYLIALLKELVYADEAIQVAIVLFLFDKNPRSLMS